MSQGKGSKRRPELSKGAWASNWDRIFGKRGADVDVSLDAKLREAVELSKRPDPPARVR